MALFENFPYTNIHELNLDWIVKIAKDFLEQYTHIQQLISDGETSLTNLTETGLASLQEKADALEALLQEWYNTHSEDIANQLADALADLNAWYSEHQNYLDQTLQDNIAQFKQTASMITEESIESIPSDYTDLTTNVDFIRSLLKRITGSNPLKVDSGNYYDLSGTQVGAKVAGDPTNNQCCFTACQPGDVFLINADSGGTTRAYAFVDANGNIIARAEANLHYSHKMLVAPPNSVAFYSDNIALPGNVPLTSYYVLYGNPIINKYNNNIDAIRHAIKYITDSYPLEIHPGYYDMSGTTITNRSINGDPSNNLCCVSACEPGDTFIISGKGGSTTRLWAFTDIDHNILLKSEEGKQLNGEIRIAPQNSAYFYSDGLMLSGVPYYVLKANISVDKDVELNISGTAQLINAGYVQPSTGMVVEPTNHTWSATDYIDISIYNTLYAYLPDMFSATDCGIAFYDRYGTYISGITYNVNSNWSSDNHTFSFMTIDRPANAKYLRASVRNADASKWYIKSVMPMDTNPPTPVIFFNNELVTPASGFANRQMIDKFIDAEDITIMVRVDVTVNSVIFLGSVDILGSEHASHVQYDFTNKTIRIYKNGTGNAIPDTVVHTVDFSSIGDLTSAQVYIGRQNRALWVAVENYATGDKISYTVPDSLNNYKYPAGWLADKLTYGIISGGANFVRISATTKVSPYIAFIGDSITEGFGIPYEDSWAYKVGSVLGSFLCLGRSGGTIITAQAQVNDILKKIKPKFVAVCIGTNGGNTDERLKNLIESIKEIGAFPLLCRIPMKENVQETNSINNVISAQNIPVAGFDHATAIGGEQNSALFQADRIHPNVQGADALARRFNDNLGLLFVR